jgi:membrane protein DedA with SNARE-associated domain
LVVGALAARGRVSLWLVIGAIAVVALAVDLVWHELGRRRGAVCSRDSAASRSNPRWIPVEALDEHLSDIPRERELVLYCS